ncbi:glycoside hydrolase family 18 [Gaoshiqia sp. Z1-71]|uniref:glycoside hydrolase family 18 n=1 Tax=Gaoshiqia hydrogeniformans TaxID=3290090 RepID=UPI003BF7F399
MKNKVEKKIRLIISGFIIAALFSACEEWAQPESLTIVQANIEEQNPELYAQYLENLKAYKNSDHKIVLAWFDNKIKIPVTRAHHLSAIPDSVDIVMMMYPDELCEREIREIESIRANKGTRVIYTISYPEIESLYSATIEAEIEESGISATETAGFTAFLNSYMNNALALTDKYNYDGICLLYKGKDLTYLDDEDKYNEYASRQEAFLSKISQWYTNHENKTLIFEGSPQNIINKPFLSSCSYIVLGNTTAASAYQLTLNTKMAITGGVPTDRFIVSVPTCSLDPDDVKTGYFTNQSGTAVRAITEAAYWVTTSEPGYKKAGIGIYNIQNDYYNTSLVYKYTREAIHIMNPSPKN